MTLVLGLTAQDGVIMVADGQATAGNGGTSTRTATQKLTAVHDRIVFGAAGAAGLRQRIEELLQTHLTPEDCGLPISELRVKLISIVGHVQFQGIREFRSVSPMSRHYGISVLFGGVDDNGSPWLFEITPEGESEIHLKAEAIGSGRPYARYALMSAEHYRLSERDLARVRLLGYRAVDDAIRTAAEALGEPIGMYEVTQDGARCMSHEDLQGVRQAVQSWQAAERAIFMGDSGQWLADGGGGSPPTSEPGIDPGVSAPSAVDAPS
ncbi:MAG: hypothetical protein ACJ762_07440 [Solirubrobacteraceae bacterium]